MKRWRLSPDEWLTLLRESKTIVDQLEPVVDGKRMLILDNWNEWAEGHYIAPHAYGGFKYLQAVRKVFTQQDNMPDYRSPQQLGFGPYDSYYQKAVREKKLIKEMK
jgi:hypothetical protein